MVFSYIRLRCPVEEGMSRYGRWIGLPEVRPPRLVRERDKIDLALADGNWLGLAVFIYPSGPWTVIEEVSGGLDTRPAADWLALAEGGDLVYAGYNDSISHAYVVVVEDGRLARHCVHYEEDPSVSLNVGRLPEETKRPFGDWIDVMGWVEADEEKLARPDEGWLWIHEGPWT